LEPDLISFLGGYKDVKLIKADENGAALQVNGAGKNIDDFYLFGRESAIGCYLYNLFIHATWGVAKWAKEVQSLDS
jgi:hypothetical protein